jgi:predicted acyltransferase
MRYAEVPQYVQQKRRIVSVDALRGFSMFWILGAEGAMLGLAEMLRGKGSVLGGVADFLETQFTHAAWEGLSFYDFIFPLFIFVTGVSIVPSLTRLVQHEGMAGAHIRVMRRALVLYVLGVLYYGGVAEGWSDMRLLGVLQRIALCYLFAALLFLHFGRRGLLTAVVVLLGGYWALLSFVPPPGSSAVSFAPDANLANWIDANFLPGRLWDGTRDPEGLLSTLPAIGTCLLGVLAGQTLMDARTTPEQKSLRLVGAGIVLIAAGYLWSIQFPLIKAIWTSSFALVCGGFASILLGMFYQVSDAWRLKRWAEVFIWIGANAVTLYLLASIVSFERLAVRLVGGDVGRLLDDALTTGAGRFAAHALGMVLAVTVAAFLYRRKIFLRV